MSPTPLLTLYFDYSPTDNLVTDFDREVGRAICAGSDTRADVKTVALHIVKPLAHHESELKINDGKLLIRFLVKD